MKLLSVAVPCYQSAGFMRSTIDALLKGGDRVEILIVDDGSKDDTPQIADEYEHSYPGICRALHQENRGHGGAVMTGLRNATGRYFKVCDSDDHLAEAPYLQVLDALERLERERTPVDLFLANYVYDKEGQRHKKVIRYANALPTGRVFSWEEVGRFRLGQYILMHAAIYRTDFLLSTGLDLPLHTFYVDSLYVYLPLRSVEKMYYLDTDLYLYYIGREGQSVQEDVMIRRYDQQIKVNRLMLEGVQLEKVAPKRKRDYMMNYLEIITTVSGVLAVRSGAEEHLRMHEQLWADMEKERPYEYRVLRHRLLGRLLNLKSRGARRFVIAVYHLAQKIFGFN
ncbi:MAG: glycosyltransferase family 2 protein [Clostridia bacterium]|nr:glycosyltransferase family 2 protein [Clostridia bacterium]